MHDMIEYMNYIIAYLNDVIEYVNDMVEYMNDIIEYVNDMIFAICHSYYIFAPFQQPYFSALESNGNIETFSSGATLSEYFGIQRE